MQLSRKAFVGAVVATLAVGIAVGAFATSRTASDRRSLTLAQALPPVQAPILPDWNPVMNQRCRCSELPWVKLSGTT